MTCKNDLDINSAPKELCLERLTVCIKQAYNYNTGRCVSGRCRGQLRALKKGQLAGPEGVQGRGFAGAGGVNSLWGTF